MKKIRQLLEPLTREELLSLLLFLGIVLTGIAVHLYRQ